MPPRWASFWTSSGFFYVLASNQNTTNSTFQVVTIEAKLQGTDERLIGTNTRSFFSTQHGPIRPNFSGTVEIPIQLRGGTTPRTVFLSIQAR